jgi:purine-binding chemotaxis protein CheW
MSKETAREQLIQDDMFLESDDDDQNENKYLLFTLGHDTYGIHIETITEIVEMPNITTVPDMPGFIKGVINLRGRVIPVMDLRLRLGMSERAYDDRTCIVIAHHENTSMGVIVDTVAEVNSIADEEIEPAPDFSSESEVRGNIVDRIGKVNDVVTLLVDVPRLLRPEASGGEVGVARELTAPVSL